MIRKTVRAAVLFVAAAAMLMVTQEASAQCGGGFGGFNRGFGGTAVNVGISRGVGFGGGFNSFGGGFNHFARPVYGSSFNRGINYGRIPTRGFSFGYSNFGRSGFRY